jgi:hypothetical protein
VAKTPQSDAAGSITDELSGDGAAAGKGRPTPTRREKEEARKRPLVSTDRAVARQKARIEMQAQREKARIGMAAGDDKYLPMRDRGAQKRYVREYVDARFSVSELMVPLLVLFIVLSFVPAQTSLVQMSTIVMVGFFLVLIGDCILLGYLVHRKLVAKYGSDRVENVRLYAAMRAIQLPFMRQPRTQVRRGQYPQ